MNNEISVEIGDGVKLVILIQVQKGKQQQQIELYEKIRPLVLEEEGCLQYELSRVVGNNEQFVLIECWESQRYLDLHDQTAHMIEADKLSASFREVPATVLTLSHLDINNNE